MSRQLTDASGASRITSSDFMDGMRAITPMVVAVVPFGIAVGAVAASTDAPTIVGWSGSVLLLGGSAQLTILQSISHGTAGAFAIVAALLVNSRLLVYSAGLAAWFPTTSIRGRLLLAIPVVDQLYITATTEFDANPRDEAARRRFYAGGAVHLWLAWIAAQAAGALLGRGVPSWLGLEAASPIALSGLLAVAMSSRNAVYAAVVAGAVIAATSSLGAPSLMIVAMLAGIAVGSIGQMNQKQVAS
jgi:predicted branched-subunit amino acid permease